MQAGIRIDSPSLRIKVFAVYNWVGVVGNTRKLYRLLVVLLIVDYINSILCVQFTVAAVVVVYAVGDVRCLLDFGNEASAADGVDASCGQEEHITGLDVVTCQDVGNTAIGNLCGIFFGSYLLLKSGKKMCTRIGGNYVPHFGFAF